jgi:glycosyltransferase involved in cell wall biosynthesis
MNIGYFVRKDWYPPTAGSSVHVYQLAKQLIQRGHRLHVINHDTADPNPGIVRYQWSEMARFMKNVDVLYIRPFGALETGKFGLLKYLRWPAVPVVWEINSPVEEYRYSGRSPQEIERLNLGRKLTGRLVDAAVCVSPALARYAADRWRIPRCEVIPSGSDTDLFNPEAAHDDTHAELNGYFKVVWAGSPQYPWQGASFLVETARRVQALDRDVRFVLIGPKAAWNKAGPLPDNVVVVGKRPYLGLAPSLASGDLGFCPCLDEDLGMGFYRSPLKLFDYMASGLPIVASDNEVTRSIIRDGKSGLLKANCVEEMAQAIVELKEDPARAKSMADKARQEAVAHFNWARVAQQTESLLLDLI